MKKFLSGMVILIAILISAPCSAQWYDVTYLQQHIEGMIQVGSYTEQFSFTSGETPTVLSRAIQHSTSGDFGETQVVATAIIDSNFDGFSFEAGFGAYASAYYGGNAESQASLTMEFVPRTKSMWYFTNLMPLPGLVSIQDLMSNEVVFYHSMNMNNWDDWIERQTILFPDHTYKLEMFMKSILNNDLNSGPFFRAEISRVPEPALCLSLLFGVVSVLFGGKGFRFNNG